MEKMVNSKAYGFFDWVFRLIVINLLTLLLSFFVVTILPAIVACMKTLKEYASGETEQVYKVYFRNFKLYSEKSFFIWLILLVIIAISFISINFYVGLDTSNLFSSAGFYMMLFMVILIILILLHLPLIIIYFPSFTIIETVRASILLGGKYIITTILLLIILVLGVMILPVLPISVLIGISLPSFMAYKLTNPIYTYLQQIKFEEKYHEDRGE
ncbi:MAG TPA: DUF624 domain-containing protein [Bacilli bacterium]|nr:DUF624 domain-containing protein [Bacilli bacterium]